MNWLIELFSKKNWQVGYECSFQDEILWDSYRHSKNTALERANKHNLEENRSKRGEGKAQRVQWYARKIQ